MTSIEQFLQSITKHELCQQLLRKEYFELQFNHLKVPEFESTYIIALKNSAYKNKLTTITSIYTLSARFSSGIIDFSQPTDEILLDLIKESFVAEILFLKLHLLDSSELAAFNSFLKKSLEKQLQYIQTNVEDYQFEIHDFSLFKTADAQSWQTGSESKWMLSLIIGSKLLEDPVEFNMYFTHSNSLPYCTSVDDVIEIYQDSALTTESGVVSYDTFLAGVFSYIQILCEQKNIQDQFLKHKLSISFDSVNSSLGTFSSARSPVSCVGVIQDIDSRHKLDLFKLQLDHVINYEDVHNKWTTSRKLSFFSKDNTRKELVLDVRDYSKATSTFLVHFFQY